MGCVMFRWFFPLLSACTSVNYLNMEGESCDPAFSEVCDDGDTDCFSCTNNATGQVTWRCSDGWVAADSPEVVDDLSCHCFFNHLSDDACEESNVQTSEH